MSTDDKIEGFLGTTFSLGKNMKVLINGKSFFASRGINITSYATMVDTYIEIESSDVPACSICCQPISARKTIDGEKVDVTTRMMMFIDASGQKYYAHYRMMTCFRQAGFELQDLSFDNQTNALGFVEREEDEFEPVPPPSYSEFLNIERENTLSFIRAEKSYNILVKPFVAKWQVRSISKSNLLEFLSDWQAMSEHTLLFVEDEISSVQFLVKVQKLIGVKV